MIKLRSKVGSKGQVVIPKPIRDFLGINPDEEVYFYVEEGRVLIEKRSPESFLDDFLDIVDEKVEMPSRVDWNEKYYSQMANR